MLLTEALRFAKLAKAIMQPLQLRSATKSAKGAPPPEFWIPGGNLLIFFAAADALLRCWMI